MLTHKWQKINFKMLYGVQFFLTIYTKIIALSSLSPVFASIYREIDAFPCKCIKFHRYNIFVTVVIELWLVLLLNRWRTNWNEMKWNDIFYAYKLILKISRHHILLMCECVCCICIYVCIGCVVWCMVRGVLMINKIKKFTKWTNAILIFFWTAHLFTVATHTQNVWNQKHTQTHTYMNEFINSFCFVFFFAPFRSVPLCSHLLHYIIKALIKSDGKSWFLRHLLSIRFCFWAELKRKTPHEKLTDIRCPEDMISTIFNIPNYKLQIKNIYTHRMKWKKKTTNRIIVL